MSPCRRCRDVAVVKGICRACGYGYRFGNGERPSAHVDPPDCAVEENYIAPRPGCAKCGRVFSQERVECKHHDRGICSECCMDEDFARRCDEARERRRISDAADNLASMGFYLPSGVVIRRTGW
jgi:hypothetical protein